MCYVWLPLYLNLSFLMAGVGEEPPVHHTFRYHNATGSAHQMQTMAFSPDSRQLAVSVSDHVDLIDTAEGEILYQFRARPFNMNYTPDGKRLYMIATDQARLLDVQSGVVIPTHYQPTIATPGIHLEEHNGKLLIKSLVRGSSADVCEALHPGDEVVAFSEGQNGEMQRITGWSLRKAMEVLAGYAGTFTRITVLPRGRYGAKNEVTLTLRRSTIPTSNRSGGVPAKLDQTLPTALGWCMQGLNWHEFRDATTGNAVAHLQTIDVQPVGLYALSPDASRFAVVSKRKDRQGVAVEVFDLATQTRLAFIPMAKPSYVDIAFAADNNRVLIGTWDTVEIADTAKEEVVSRMLLGYHMPKKGERQNADSPIGGLVINSIRAEVGSGGWFGTSSPQLVAKLAVSSRNIVAVGDGDGNVGLWDLETGEAVGRLPSEGDDQVEQLMFSPDGRWLAYYVGGTLHLEDVSRVEPSKDVTESPENQTSDQASSADRVTVISAD